MEKFFSQPGLASRLDLVREATALLRGAENREIEGVAEEVEEEDGVTLHRITIRNQEAACRLGRPQGSYLTYELPELTSREVLLSSAAQVSRGLSQLLPPLDGGCLLLAGLGNSQAAPDALGPTVVGRTYATRHLFTAGGQPPEGLAPVAALAPGVQGMSGLDAAEQIAAICRGLRPAAVIAVDALAAASVRRVGVTIQLTDTGLSPGSGVDNSRPQLNRATLGCPVIAVGAPTVVDAAAIISEALTALSERWQGKAYVVPPQVEDGDRDYVEQRLLSAFPGRLLVTPKDIDRIIVDLAELIAAAVALAAHPGCGPENCRDFIR